MRQTSVKARAFRSVSGVGAVLATALGFGELACRTSSEALEATAPDGAVPAEASADASGDAPGDAAPSPYIACADPAPLLIGGKDTGFVKCAGGALHRANASDCPVIPRDAGDGGGGGGGTCTGPACAVDTDCTAKPLGRCDNNGGRSACACTYGCVRDGDCAAGELCECGGLFAGRCVAASCTLDSQCPQGGLCASVVNEEVCSIPRAVAQVYRCQTAGDECLDNGDCNVADGGRPPTCFLNDAGPPTRVCRDLTKFCPPGPPGRPFLIAGVARVAPLAVSREWLATGVAPVVFKLTPAARQTVAAYYNRAGQMEHASIAAFARFALELLGLGAPSALLVGTHEAMADETEHAKMTFALASAYGGRPSGPGRLAMDGALGACTPERVFATLVREGCIGETLAAVEATEALARATDHAVKAVLERIAVDEARHAALSWRAARWLLAQGDDRFRTWAAAELTRALAERRTSTVAVVTADRTLEAHGVLDPGTLGQLARATLDDVLEPLARAMLEPPRLIFRDLGLVSS